MAWPWPQALSFLGVPAVMGARRSLREPQCLWLWRGQGEPQPLGLQKGAMGWGWRVLRKEGSYSGKGRAGLRAQQWAEMGLAQIDSVCGASWGLWPWWEHVDLGPRHTQPPQQVWAGQMEPRLDTLPEMGWCPHVGYRHLSVGGWTLLQALPHH